MIRNRKLIVLLLSFLICSSIIAFISMNPASAENGEGRYLSIDVNNADIRDILSAVAIHLDKSIIFTGQAVNVNFSIEDVDARTALDYLLKTVGMDYIEDSSVLIVGTRDILTREFYTNIALTKFTLKYIKSDIIAAQIDALGIPVQKVTLDSNQNAIWVQGLPKELSKVHELITMLDKPENSGDGYSSSTALTPLVMKYITAEQMNRVLLDMGISGGIIIESNPMTLWIHGSSKQAAEIKSIQATVDIIENAMSESIVLTPIKLKYITNDEVMEIFKDLEGNLGFKINLIAFGKTLQTIWLNGDQEAVEAAIAIISKLDVEENVHDNVFFTYKLINIKAKEAVKRFEKLGLERVYVQTLNFPEFTQDLLVFCPPDYKVFVMNFINKMDIMTDKIKMPVDYSDIPGGGVRLKERRDLIVELTDIPVESFTITGNISRDDEFIYILYLYETPENIQMVKDLIKYIDDPLLEGTI